MTDFDTNVWLAQLRAVLNNMPDDKPTRQVALDYVTARLGVGLDPPQAMNAEALLRALASPMARMSVEMECPVHINTDPRGGGWREHYLITRIDLRVYGDDGRVVADFFARRSRSSQ